MKNLSISKKLIIGFGIVLVLLILSGLLSVYNTDSIGNQIELYGQYTVPNAEHIRIMQVNMRGILSEILEAFSEDAAGAKNSLDIAGQYGKQVVAELDAYKNNQRNHDRDADIEKFRTVITEAASVRGKISELILSGSKTNNDKAQLLFKNEYKPKIDEAIKILDQFSAMAKERSETQRNEAQKTIRLSLIIVISVSVVSILITIGVIIIIRKSILTPIKEIVDVYGEISRGNIKTEIKYESRDEIGQMAMLIQKTNMLQSNVLSDVIEKFVRISQRDLQIHVDMDYPGDFAILKNVIEETVLNLNNTMENISIAAEQVSTGSDQVSSGAQALASGSTEQAASIEELSASVTKIAEQASENSENVKRATEYVEQAAHGVNAGNEQMQQLTEAMEDIGAASDKITNITKVIEDIAFQTNILALNAAIEAARAGTAGKGFAVVADEVRNLAAKSAEAAKQTTELIQTSVATVRKGSQITEHTAQILQDVGVKEAKVTESIDKIEKASIEQADAIEQIMQGLSQISDVVQTNAATAEENSATSEEMSAQAAALSEEVGKFKLNSNNKYENIAVMSF